MYIYIYMYINIQCQFFHPIYGMITPFLPITNQWSLRHCMTHRNLALDVVAVLGTRGQLQPGAGVSINGDTQTCMLCKGKSHRSK